MCLYLCLCVEVLFQNAFTKKFCFVLFRFEKI